jgi:hypothetical protein
VINLKKIICALLVMGFLAGCNQSKIEVLDQSNEPLPSPIVSQDTQIDDSIYIGEYLDLDINEPNLKIAKREDGNYDVEISIYRLTYLDDGIGTLTKDGMEFTATDANGDPIKGIIKVEDKVATVTFTDSTWELIKNGDSFEYTKI